MVICKCKKHRKKPVNTDDFVIGCRVMRTYHRERNGMRTGDFATVKSVDEFDEVVTLNEYEGNHAMYALEVVKPNKALEAVMPKRNGETNMNSTIAAIFDKTADAVLVERHLGKNIKENIISVILLKPHKDEILKAAQAIAVKKEREGGSPSPDNNNEDE